MAQGIFTLAYMSHDHLHGSHAGLPMVERVKTTSEIKIDIDKAAMQIIRTDPKYNLSSDSHWASQKSKISYLCKSQNKWNQTL